MSLSRDRLVGKIYTSKNNIWCWSKRSPNIPKPRAFNVPPGCQTILWAQTPQVYTPTSDRVGFAYAGLLSISRYVHALICVYINIMSENGFTYLTEPPWNLTHSQGHPTHHHAIATIVAQLKLSWCYGSHLAVTQCTRMLLASTGKYKATCNYGTMKYQWKDYRFQWSDFIGLHNFSCTQLPLWWFNIIVRPCDSDWWTNNPHPITSDRGGLKVSDSPVSSKPTGRGASGVACGCGWKDDIDIIFWTKKQHETWNKDDVKYWLVIWFV